MPLSQTPRATISVALRRHRAHNRGRRKIKIPIAFAAQPVTHRPRLRALALFGRRPVQHADYLVMPASKNLHITGLCGAAYSEVLYDDCPCSGNASRTGHHRCRPLPIMMKMAAALI